MRKMRKRALAALACFALLTGFGATPLSAQTVTFLPYIQPGDAGTFGPADQMVIAWQTDETTPHPGAYTVQFGTTILSPASVSPIGRVVDNYLAADPQFSALSIPTAYGAHTNYYALLTNLNYDTTYFYKVTGPGLPADGFLASFHTRKRGGQYAFQVQGDEGFYPSIPQSLLIENWEARIIYMMYHVHDLTFPNQPGLVPTPLPKPDFALNTGDNVYVVGSDANYRDFWFGDWNSDLDTLDDGAPFLRDTLLWIAAGNHDIGATGASANLLADDPPTVPGSRGPGLFGGGVSGGDALAQFNNFYYSLNGPTGVDIQNIFTGDNVSPTGMFFKYLGVNYTSPAAIEAYRASTTVDTGQGAKRQIDHESNYSFDYGNAHFVFLDANPHLFNALLPGGPPNNEPVFPFTAYPSILRKWLINDLDNSKQIWKFVVFHQPTFSSGNATISNDQMRRVAKFLEDHGVNIVFNGHEHNYQRSLPIRTLPGVDSTPKSTGPPVVAVDTHFDGATHTVPDGVLYFVEGTGGNRDFDDNIPNPRGGGLGIDQDDSATGTFHITVAGKDYDVPVGSASWLDTNLTTSAMIPFIPNAGIGPKITAKFKSKVFGFAEVIVNDNALTLYQISEPLSDVSSATTTTPAPFGTDINGKPLNDPLPDTLIDPTTGDNFQTTGGQGTPALLDKVTVTKPDVSAALTAKLAAPPAAAAHGAVVYTISLSHNGAFALNGTQVVVTLPVGVTFAGTVSDNVTVQGQDVVVTLGRFVPSEKRVLQVKGRVAVGTASGTALVASAVVRSSTALPVGANTVTTTVVGAPPPGP